MGRPRGFSEAAVLQAATEIFTRGGYAGTSVDDLVKGLNLHRGSLYKAFGSKHGLFLAVLRHCLERQLAAVIQPAITGDTAASELIDKLTRAPELDLLLVAAVERGPQDAEVAALVRTALLMIEQATEAADPRPADGATARPARAIELLGVRLFERLYPEPDHPHRPTRPTRGSTKET